MQGRHKVDQVPGVFPIQDFYTNQIRAGMSDIDPLGLCNHVLDRSGADSNRAALVIIA
jgi:hypothetical protein